MPTTTNLSLPFLEAGQAQKHVTHNEALRLLDAVTQLAVLSVSASPPGSPANGERHIVGTDPSGAFAGHENEVAAWQDGAWVFLAPQPGWRAWNIGDEALLVWTGAAWSEISAGGGGEGGGDVTGPDGGVADGDVAVFDGTTGKAIKKDRGTIDYLGIGAPPDATDTDTSNRLVVKASRVVFHAREDVETPGTGDIKIQISKEDEANSASLFFSSNFSGRAEFGLVESDAFKLKVSPDNDTWFEAMVFDPATGKVSFPQGMAFIEQGTFTPAFTFATPGDLSVSYSEQVGYFIRVGDMVIALVHISATPTYSTASGQILVTGLPFTVADPLVANTFQHGSNLQYPSGVTTLVTRPVAGETAFQIFGLGQGVASPLSATHQASGTSFVARALLTYRRQS